MRQTHLESSGPRLLIGSGNPHKIAELLCGLNGSDIPCVSLSDLPDAPEVVEDGKTFEANARKKACVWSRFSGLWTLSDDSGIEVDALDNAPGVLSARFAGSHGDDAANIRKLLDCLAGCTNRRARFRCVLALAAPDGQCETIEGVCNGSIAFTPKGRNGFGYDPVFIPEGYRGTFGTLSPRTKARLSHRAQALRLARQRWRDRLDAPC